MITPLQIKLAAYALMAILVIGAYFGWAYHQQQIGYAEAEAKQAKEDKRIAEESEKLMAHEKAEVERKNNENNERLKNAIQIYADDATRSNDDAVALANRLRRSAKATTCNQNTVPGRVDNNTSGERPDSWTDREIEEYARIAVQIENELKRKVNELRVFN